MRIGLAAGAALALICLVGPAAAQPGAHGAARARGAHPMEGLWRVNFIMPIEATPQTPKLVVSEGEAKAIAKAIKAQYNGFFEMFLDPEVPVLLDQVEGLPIVRGERRTRVVVQPADGRLPYTPAARRESEAPPPQTPMDNPETMTSAERCLEGAGQAPLVTFPFDNEIQIVITREQVVMHVEYGDDLRVVPITDRHGPAVLAGRLGDSIGHWEGKTLVIETVGMPNDDRVRFFPVLIVPGEATVIERLTPISDRELLYQFTVLEPKAYAAPWLGEFSWFRTTKPIFESACHEGNYALGNELAGARYEEREASAHAAR